MIISSPSSTPSSSSSSPPLLQRPAIVARKDALAPTVDAQEPIPVDVLALADLGIFWEREFVLDAVLRPVGPACEHAHTDAAAGGVLATAAADGRVGWTVEASTIRRFRLCLLGLVAPTPYSLFRVRGGVKGVAAYEVFDDDASLAKD